MFYLEPSPRVSLERKEYCQSRRQVEVTQKTHSSFRLSNDLGLVMRINNIEIQGYRSYGRRIALSGIPPVSLFIGANNTGKSNLLKGIDWLFEKIKLVQNPKQGAPGQHMNGDEFYPNRYGREGSKDLINIKSEISDKDYSIYISLYCGEYQNKQVRIGYTIKDNKNPGFYIIKYNENNGHFFTQEQIPNEKMKSNGNDYIRHCVSTIAGTGVNDSRHTYIEANRNALSMPFEKESGQKDYIDMLKGILTLRTDTHHSTVSALERFISSILNEKESRISLDDSSTSKGREIYIAFSEKMYGPKTMPLENLGSGTQDLVFVGIELAAQDKDIFLLEEPETHLHADWQRKLFSYIVNLSKTGKQFFITTHSSIMLDAAREYGQNEVGVYRVGLDDDGLSEITRCDKDVLKQSYILDDLGCRASDVLQANSVIWVEGPSDCVYIRKWIDIWQTKNSVDEGRRIREGTHFVFAMFGGSNLASHSAEPKAVDEIDPSDKEKFRMYHLNRRAIVVVDRDNKKSTWSLHKDRIEKEVKEINGIFWMTHGITIEDYIPKEVWKRARTNRKGYWTRKHYRSIRLMKAFKDDDMKSDLEKKIEKLITAIRSWNGL